MSEPAPEVGASDGADPARPPSLDSDAARPATPDADPTRPPSRDSDPTRPTYKGAPLDAERGPGLGCFWIQVVLLVTLLIATPVSVWISAPPWVSAALLLISLGLLFFVGQTSIFLLRLVAADRRAQRRPLREGARPTVGQLSQEPNGDKQNRDSDRDSDEDHARPPED